MPQPNLTDLLTRGVDQIIGADELRQALGSDRKLRLKFGVDPTRPDLHIGHAVVMRKLRALQDLGHTVIFLIGDYTTKIGDPSGKSKTRPILSDAEIQTNVKTYLDQVGQLLDINQAEIRYNSEWLGQLSFGDLVGLAANFSVAQTIERDDFKNRLQSGQEVSLHELLYPLMQAYDSVILKADAEFGGTDQLFNLMAGRDLQKKLGQPPQIIFTCKLLIGLDGTNKMSKSLDNYVAVTDTPSDMFGKIMSLPDPLIIHYFELCTDVDLDQLKAVEQTLTAAANPRDVKASLAREIVRIYHDESAAREAAAAFDKQFRDHELPADIPDYHVNADSLRLSDLLVESDLASSKSEARRLIEQNGVKLNQTVVTSDDVIKFKTGDLIQVGKRRFLRLKLKP